MGCHCALGELVCEKATVWVCLHHLIQEFKGGTSLPWEVFQGPPNKDIERAGLKQMNSLLSSANNPSVCEFPCGNWVGTEPPTEWLCCQILDGPRACWGTHLTAAGLWEQTKPSSEQVRGWVSWQLGKGAPIYVNHDRCATSAAAEDMENTKWEARRGGDSSPTPPWVLPPCPAPSPTLLWAQHGHKRKSLGHLLLGEGLRREATWSNITNPLPPNLLLIIKLFKVNHSSQNSVQYQVAEICAL